MSHLLTQNLLVTLKALQSSDNNNTHQLTHIARDILYDIYDIELGQINLSESEKEEIGPLIIKALPAIELCVNYEAMCWLTTTIKNACIIRSGIQFLLDNHNNYFSQRDFEEYVQILFNLKPEIDLEDFDDLIKTYWLHEVKAYIDDKFIKETALKFKSLNTKTPHIWWEICG